eukprot:TRINITY_DN51099_c0_g2_i1.p1 TRINITY_DN51099_c0_g2~~TRINITY_DN51099_c0_g2_i1.p1  ORF type:complete len:396 (+),score=49.55 TRINITY_DN51099_c0_g2_i1:88-1275(+)
MCIRDRYGEKCHAMRWGQGVLCALCCLTPSMLAHDTVELSPGGAQLPEGFNHVFQSSSKRPPMALESTPRASLDQDGVADSKLPTGTQVGPRETHKKSSHDWVHVVDRFSPLLFNWRYYAAKYNLEGQTEAQVRADWTRHVEQDAAAPDCRQGQPLFSVVKYMENNPTVKANIQSSCSKGLNSYLTQGIYNGASGEVGRRLSASTRGGKTTRISLKRGLKMSQELFLPSNTYTLTWWQRFDTAGGGSWRSVLHYGNHDDLYPKSPSVLQYPSTLEKPSTRLSFIVSHTDNPDFHCNPTPQLPVNKWTFVGLAVKQSSVEVFYDGKLVCQNASTTGGTTLVPRNQHLYLGDVFHPAAYAQVDGMIMYNEVMNAGMLTAIMSIDPPKNEEDLQDLEE